MGKKEKYINDLFKNPITKNFTEIKLDKLMNECGCIKYSGGRGSSLKYVHNKTGKILTFDGPHPGKELYIYHIKMVRKYLKDIGEVE